MSKKKPTRQVNNAEDIAVLEKLVKKLIRTGFKDNTLDYTVQIAISSLEPGKVKYGFMVNGLKKEIDMFAHSFYTFREAKAVLEGMIKEINPLEVEKTFHKGRINVYKSAITSHEGRLETISDPNYKPDEDIEMEQV